VETNREVLAGMTGVPCLGELPFAGEPVSFNGETLDRLEQQLDLRWIELALKNP
jgi:hypothetical protein